jgi:Protein tyrosine and serine/threonine kinase
METSYDLVLHDNYGLSSARASSQRSTKAPEINSVAGIVSLALQLGVPILNQSGNSRLERTNLAAGVSSKTTVFKLQSHLAALKDTNSNYGGNLVVSKHVPKWYAESESQRYDALVRDMLFLSHGPIARHDRFVNIIAIAWEDAEDIVENRIWPVLLFEFAEYGTLEDFFNLDDTDKSWNTKQAICGDVAAALDWLHECRIIHSDVKFANVLVFRDPGPTVHRAKLSDFGFALDVDALEAFGQEAARLDGFTPPCAPEAETLMPLSLLTKFDIFSYGLLVGRVFLNGNEAFSKVLQGNPSANLAYEFEKSCEKLGYNDEQLQLVRKIIASTTFVDPESRIEMKDALKMISASEKTK